MTTEQKVTVAVAILSVLVGPIVLLLVSWVKEWASSSTSNSRQTFTSRIVRDEIRPLHEDLADLSARISRIEGILMGGRSGGGGRRKD